MMKELLVSFFACLVIGAVINGSANAPQKSPIQPAESVGLLPDTQSSQGSGAAESPPAPQTSDADFQADVLDASNPVLVDFSTSWCGPCQRMAPVLDQLASEYDGKMKVVTLDADMNPVTRARFEVNEFPTFIIFKNGRQIARFSGARPKEAMVQEMEKVLTTG